MPLKITDPNLTLVMDIYGESLKYYAGRLCSCIAENEGRPKTDCGCNLGFYYDEPIPLYGIRTNFNYKFTQTPHGRIFDGGAKFTIPKSYNGVEQSAFQRITHGDIISITNKFRRETENLKRGIRDTLYAFDVNKIFVVSQREKIYRAGVDYRVNDRTIEWLSGGEAPKENEFYSVEYSCTQQFKVWENGASSRGTSEDDLPLNILCVIRRYVEIEQTNPLDNYSSIKESVFNDIVI